MKADILQADILIVGGGSAGAMAAIRAKELDASLKVVIFEKADLKYSGSIPRGMDALNIVAVPGVATAKEYVECAVNTDMQIVDENVRFAIADRSWDILKKLESWGVCFPMDEQGNYEILSVTNKSRFVVTMQEPNLKTILYERVEAAGCITMNRTMAVEILMRDGRVCGAVGVNVRTGEIIVCQAKAVILAAGGTARFSIPSNGYLYGIYDCPANSGDAYALAYQAGAELTGFEYTQSVYIVKDINCPLLHPTTTRGAHIIKADNERLTYAKDSQLVSMYDEHYHKGNGFLRLRMSHLTPDQVDAITEILFSTERPVLERFLEERGIDPHVDDIELAPTDFYLCGGHGLTGVKIDEHAASSVPGLYAAGDAANGHGYLTGAFTLGEIAAEAAGAYVAGLAGEPCDPTDAVRRCEEKIERWYNSPGQIPIEEFEYKVRRMITDYVIPPKNDYKLNRALESMAQMADELTHTVRIENAHDLIKAFELENIILCAALSARSSLERKESRWGFYHYRSDYPQQDPNYIKHVVVRRTADDPMLTYLVDPVKLAEGGAR